MHPTYNKRYSQHSAIARNQERQERQDYREYAGRPIPRTPCTHHCSRNKDEISCIEKKPMRRVVSEYDGYCGPRRKTDTTQRNPRKKSKNSDQTHTDGHSFFRSRDGNVPISTVPFRWGIVGLRSLRRPSSRECLYLSTQPKKLLHSVSPTPGTIHRRPARR